MHFYRKIFAGGNPDRAVDVFFILKAPAFVGSLSIQITQPRYSSPYSWPLNNILVLQKKWEIKRKMKAIGWAGKNLVKVSMTVKYYFYYSKPKMCVK